LSLKLQASAISVLSENIVANARYILQDVGLERFQRAKVAFRITQGDYYWCYFV